MHQIQFRLGLRPRPHAEGAHSAPPDPLADFKGSYFYGNGRGGRTGVRRRGEGFLLYLSISGLRKGPGKFLTEVLESPGSPGFFVSKRVGALLFNLKHIDDEVGCGAVQRVPLSFAGDETLKFPCGQTGSVPDYQDLFNDDISSSSSSLPSEFTCV